MHRRWLAIAGSPLFLLLPLAVGEPATFDTLDALIKHYDSTPCQTCHTQVHAERSKSFHARSIEAEANPFRGTRTE
jgi:hypothetical protein